MVTNTGNLYNLEELYKAGVPAPQFDVKPYVSADDLPRQTADESELLGKLRGELNTRMEEIDRQAVLVPVGAEAVQKIRLGERELERRRRRNAAAKQARKRNR